MRKFNVGDKVKIVRRYPTCSTSIIEHENEIVTVKAHRPYGKNFQYQLEEYPTEKVLNYNFEIWWNEGCFAEVNA